MLKDVRGVMEQGTRKSCVQGQEARQLSTRKAGAVGVLVLWNLSMKLVSVIHLGGILPGCA